MTPSIFLDLDNMLVKSFSRRDHASIARAVETLPDVKTTYNGVVTVLRPGARMFLEEVNKLGNVYLLTAAQLSYAKSIIKAFDLGSYFIKYYTTVYHSPNSIAHELNLNGMPWVLVEDSPATLKITQYKLESLGVNQEQMANSAFLEKHYIEVKPYAPLQPFDGGGLEEIAGVVQEKIKYLEKRLILF